MIHPFNTLLELSKDNSIGEFSFLFQIQGRNEIFTYEINQDNINNYGNILDTIYDKFYLEIYEFMYD